MPRWLPRLLKRIHELAGQRRVRLTLKAARELAVLGAGLDVQDACDVLGALSGNDFADRFESELTGEWMTCSSPRLPGRWSISSSSCGRSAWWSLSMKMKMKMKMKTRAKSNEEHS